jgi:predicted permease
MCFFHSHRLDEFVGTHFSVASVAFEEISSQNVAEAFTFIAFIYFQMGNFLRCKVGNFFELSYTGRSKKHESIVHLFIGGF